jgi:hypothetical protein
MSDAMEEFEQTDEKQRFDRENNIAIDFDPK